MEIHCGEWEMRGWDDLPKEAVDPWMKDFVQVRIPGGESYLDLHQRVTGSFHNIYDSRVTGDGAATAIVAHGGVIRSSMRYCPICRPPKKSSTSQRAFIPAMQTDQRNFAPCSASTGTSSSP
jgi:alpha-ribazole phosphatase